VPVLIAFLLMVVQQLSGINAVIFYSVSIFEDAGSSLGSGASAVVVAAVMVAATGVASLVADKVGRKPLLIASATGMAVSMTTMSFYFYFEHV
jgi:MFS family permease